MIQLPDIRKSPNFFFMFIATWLLLPLSLTCWWYAYQLYRSSLEPLGHRHSNDMSHGEVWKEFDSRSSQDEDTMVPGDQPNNVFYFLHISDIHVSRFRRKGSIEHLRILLNSTLPTIKPSFVVVTGDLTDAKDAYKVSSTQYRDEWVEYHETLKEAGVLDKKGFWMDQRGNHDCFDLPGWDHHLNYFKIFSSAKEEQYTYQHKTEFGKYTFIVMDACPVMGPGRPFNFFGYLDRSDLDYLQARIIETRPSNHTFVLSHYPIATTISGFSSDGERFQDIAKRISVYMCGHLHKLAAGIGNVLHAYHPQRFLELELSDLKVHASYRIMAVDHDLISFIDTSLFHPNISGHVPIKGRYIPMHLKNIPPTVLITNPKDARYVMKRREPLHRMLRSTHIRVLVFSPSKVVKVVAFMDDHELNTSAKFVGTSVEENYMPLWAIRWTPSNYNDGQRHMLRVVAHDEHGNTGEHVIPVYVNGTRDEIEPHLGKSILMADFDYTFKTVFLIGYFVITVLLMLIPKLYTTYLHQTGKYDEWRRQYSAFLIRLDTPRLVTLPDNQKERFKAKWRIRFSLMLIDFKYFVYASFFRYCTLAGMSWTFYPLYYQALYILIGPYFIGELIPSSHTSTPTSSFAAFYLYGIYIDNTWLPLLDTYLYGIFELIYLFAPLLIYLSFCITPPSQLYAPSSHLGEPKENQVYVPPRHNRRYFPVHRRISVRVLVCVCVLYQLTNVLSIGFFYGPYAVLLSPGKTWFVMWACYALWKHRWSAKGDRVDLMDRSEKGE